MKNPKVRLITNTAILIALLVALQWATAPTKAFAGQFITGSCVNAVLALAVLMCGLCSGVLVAVLSPFCAFLLGVGPQVIQIVPGIAFGNILFVGVLYLLIGNRKRNLWRQGVGLAAAAIAKFAGLFILINKCIVPLMGESLKPQQTATFLTMFSWPQLVTALLGGAIALAILPVLKKALHR